MQLKQFVQKLPHMQHVKLSLSKREECGEGEDRRGGGEGRERRVRGWEKRDEERGLGGSKGGERGMRKGGL